MLTIEKKGARIVEKAVVRAEWYRSNYRGAKNYEKNYRKQFWNIVKKECKKDTRPGVSSWILANVPVQFKEGGK